MADVHADKNQDEWNEETVYGPSTVIAALDQIEDLVESSRSVPLSASIMINKAELLDLLDQARQALPEDLVAADAGVMEQPREAVNPPRAARVPIMVAGHNIDKHTATPNRLLQAPPPLRTHAH